MEARFIRKGEKTKQHVIEKTSILFNQRGYVSTSMADVTAVTGLHKGGIYNHFRDKEELTLQSFEHNCLFIENYVMKKVQPLTSPLEKLMTFVNQFSLLGYPGGCPIAKAAFDADNVMDSLFNNAREAMTQLLNFLTLTIAEGISQNEIKKEVDPQHVAMYIISCIEGGLLLQKLYPESTSINIVYEQLIKFIDNELVSASV